MINSTTSLYTKLFQGLKPRLQSCVLTYCSSVQPSNVPVKEVRIPVPWGHIAAKLWGDDQKRPILALHGWQDNAGTWDTLAPKICDKLPVLAIDFPGHGLSSWIPKGIQYYAWDVFWRVILIVKRHYKWNKVSLLGHSMGSIFSMRYACLFPDDVDFFIAIDNLFAEDYDLKEFVNALPNMLLKLQTAQEREVSEPPLYNSLDEIYMKWHQGSNKSISLESVKYLAERGIKLTSENPQKYYFNKDPRLSISFFDPENRHFLELLSRRLNCPTLYIKAKDSKFATSSIAVELRKIVEESNVQLKTHVVPGTHHVHLNNSDVVMPLIIDFLKTNRFIDHN